MKALISTIEPRQTGFRVAQVVKDDEVFEVAPVASWIDCPDDTVADQVWYDPENKTFNAFPAVVPENVTQPISQGVQTL
jgi:hypothetical protein